MEDRPENLRSDIRIVIVDDDQFQLKLLSNQLFMVGYKNVTAFDDGDTARSNLLGHDAAKTLVILNLDMPNMDEEEFLQMLADSNFPGALLYIAPEEDDALASAKTLASSLNLNVLGHINKPIQQSELQAYLKRLASLSEDSTQTVKQHNYQPERLLQAIEDGELVNYYQPKVHLETGNLVGVEALVRWEHPDDGVVSPDGFIDLAEENELIDKVAQQVLRNAMADSTIWKQEGLALSIAVNISMYNLNTKEFITYLENELLSSGVNPQDLTLEIRETELLKDYSLVLDMLTRLRLRRVNLSIDDFGKGRSSITQLQDLPFNEFKIDRDIVHSAHEDEALHGAFDGSIKLAKNLGIRTVAEGVENEADWTFLGGSGCDLAQGFFIGKPMRALELSDWNVQWAGRYAEITL